MEDNRLHEIRKELNSDPIKTDPIKIEIKELGGSRMESTDLLHQKQFELMIEMATKKLEMKIEGLKDEISSLKKEVERLKTVRAEPQNKNAENHDTLKVPDDVKVEGFMQVKTPTRPVMSSTSEHAKGEGPTVHPRLGNYKTEDVSVEKFFNFGRK